MKKQAVFYREEDLSYLHFVLTYPCARAGIPLILSPDFVEIFDEMIACYSDSNHDCGGFGAPLYPESLLNAV